MNKTISPPTPSRVSVPVDAATLEVFQRLAKAANQSTGKAMAEWLKDTVDAAELMASTMERARAAPKIVTAELHAMMLGMADQTKAMQDKYSAFRGPLDGGGVPRAHSARGNMTAAGGAGSENPPSSNTGGKVPNKKQGLTPSRAVFPLPPAKVQAHADTNGIPPKAPK